MNDTKILASIGVVPEIVLRHVQGSKNVNIHQLKIQL